MIALMLLVLVAAFLLGVVGFGCAHSRFNASSVRGMPFKSCWFQSPPLSVSSCSHNGVGADLSASCCLLPKFPLSVSFSHGTANSTRRDAPLSGHALERLKPEPSRFAWQSTGASALGFAVDVTSFALDDFIFLPSLAGGQTFMEDFGATVIVGDLPVFAKDFGFALAFASDDIKGAGPRRGHRPSA